MCKQILVVDDEEDVRAITKLGLEMGAGWEVLTACCGEDALSMAANFHPDAILLDLMMPDMDGRTTLQHLKANPMTQSIPVILVTAKSQQTELESFSQLEIAAVVAKPFRPLQLAQLVNQALGWN
jgi:CheY-like chemotaxis protein